MGVLVNRARMSVSGAPGTGTITLGSAQTGYQSFAAAGVTDQQRVSYLIEDAGGAWEVGQGTYTASGTTLSRTVQGSSNGGSAIAATAAAVVSIAALASDLFTPWIPVAFAASLTLDFTGRNFEVGALTANLTLNNPSNIASAVGQGGMISLPQDSTGGRTITVGSVWKFPGGAPTLSTAASAVDAIAYEVRSTTFIYANLLKAFA